LLLTRALLWQCCSYCCRGVADVAYLAAALPAAIVAGRAAFAATSRAAVVSARASTAACLAVVISDRAATAIWLAGDAVSAGTVATASRTAAVVAGAG
jgi:hypothetical protein